MPRLEVTQDFSSFGKTHLVGETVPHEIVAGWPEDTLATRIERGFVRYVGDGEALVSEAKDKVEALLREAENKAKALLLAAEEKGREAALRLELVGKSKKELLSLAIERYGEELKDSAPVAELIDAIVALSKA